MADTKSEKDTSENLFQIAKRIVKNFAEDFQIIDNEIKILIDQILDYNMPLHPNPLQHWHEIYDPITNLHVDDFTGEKLPKTPKIVKEFSKGMARTGNTMNILKCSSVYKNILKAMKLPQREKDRVKFKRQAKLTEKVINESVIK